MSRPTPLPPFLIFALCALIIMSALTAIASILAGCSSPSFAITETSEDAPIADSALEDAPIADSALEDAPIADSPLEDAPIADSALEDAPIADSALEDAPIADSATHDAKPDTHDSGMNCSQCSGSCPLGNDDSECFSQCLGSGYTRCTWTPSGSPRCVCRL